jgi:iron complex outermembrane receptor protein
MDLSYAAILVCASLMTTGAYAEEPPKPTAPQPLPSYEETMEVTASRSQEPLLDTPVSLTVITRQQIDASAADNYADLLRGVPGLNVVQTSARDLSIRARGPTKVAENTQIALVDGRSVYLDYYGIVVWDYLPFDLDEVKSIEVLRGAGSAVWGANAMSGVINILTRPPREISGGTLTLRAGERDTKAASVLWGQTAGSLSYKVSASYFEQDPWPRDNLLPDGTPFPFGYTYPNEGTRQPKFDARADIALNDVSALSVRGGYGGTTGIFHSNVGPFLIERGAHVMYGDTSYTRGSAEVKLYVNHLNGDAPNLINGLPFSFLMTTVVAEATNRTLVGTKHMLVYGVSARSNRFDLSIAPGTNSRNDGGVFLEDIYAVSDRLEINAGVRVDSFEVLGTVASPRLSVIVKPAPNHAVRLSANRAYRAPTLVENFIDTTIPNVVVLPPANAVFFASRVAGNQNLEPESSTAFELGYSARFHRYYVDASIYRNTVKNNTVFFPSEFYSPADPPAGWPLPPATVPVFALPKTFTFFNVGRARNEGLDLSAEFRPRPTATARASYTYQRDPQVENDHPFVPLVVNRPPRHMASVSGEIHEARWFAGASVTYSDRAFWADVLDPRFWGSTEAYTLVSASGGRHFGARTEVAIEGTNLFDRRVKQHVFGDVIGRKMTMRVRYRFD